MNSLINTEITITNGGSYTTCWIIKIGESRYYVRTDSSLGLSWVVEKHDPETGYCDWLTGFRCKDNFNALNRGLVIATQDYQNQA